MIKYGLTFLILFTAGIISAPAQHRVVRTSTGQTEFFSKAAGPAQDIYAIDKTAQAQLDLTDGSVEVKIAMKNFTFPRSLMQKHYNERYMETEKYPNATFKGRLIDWEAPSKDGVIEVTASGDLTVHGVTRKRQIKGKLTKKKDSYEFDAVFEVKLQEHNITIPVLFFTKITESVQVTVQYPLNP